MSEFLYANQFEVLVYQAVTAEVQKLIDQRDENLAVRIANAVAKSFSNTS